MLYGLRYGTGLFAAAKKSVMTGYDKAWIRDNIYIAIGLEEAGYKATATATYRALFDVFLKHEYKIDWAVKEKPDQAFKYLHARYNPVSLEEFQEPWGNKQNDAIGLFLFKVGDLFRKGVIVFRGEDDIRILKKLVSYLGSVEYWQDRDNGVWEENEEVHASSVGACVAGLQAVNEIVNVPADIIEKGREALNRLLPRESETKETDMALLSLIYPLNVVSAEQREAILKNIEEKLVRNKGVIRYEGDRYYGREGKDGEAEWCLGLIWLARIYKDLGIMNKYSFYLEKAMEAMNNEGELPELYFAGSKEHNENTPLGWAQAMVLAPI